MPEEPPIPGKMLIVPRDSSITSSQIGVLPGFSVGKNGVNQNISNGSNQKITWDASVADWDTENAFDDANDRYTPNIAGKYLITVTLMLNSMGTNEEFQIIISKNGNQYSNVFSLHAHASMNMRGSGSAIISMNGSTDYVEIFAQHNHSPNLDINGGSEAARFAGQFLSK